MGFGCGEAVVDGLPVDDVPPCGEVIWPAVVVGEVVGVLPDVVAKDGVMTLREGVILVGGGDDFELGGVAGAFEHQPSPAGAKLLGSGFIELLFKVVKGAEGDVDEVSDVAGGSAAAAGLHDLPKHGVVDVAAAVVLDDFANVLRE